ncbi:hypothetical protein C0989_000483 [Termitomyces sp. Mn162]|nr:hypothetical protein C0989_000483 [Termitomyces sp. Mn162]
MRHEKKLMSLEDHNVIFAPYFASEDSDTMDVIFRGSEAEIERSDAIHSGLDAGVKLRPNADDLKEIGPHFEPKWKTYFENAPDKPVTWLGPFAT